ncbi:MAG: DNA polymerase III subunit delta, partial [Thermaceae bacterium]|nr:DNA polymerase III subunit delta [Thermaceae bacterium]
IDGEEADFDRLSEALTSLPFLASKKLVILRGTAANKKFIEKAGELLPEVPETTDVIIIEPKLDKRSVYYKLLKKITDYKEFNELDINGLARWLVGQAQAQKGMLSNNDARYLVEWVGMNQQLLANELDKLLLYAPKVTRESIELLTEPVPQSTVFELLEAAFNGNGHRTMALYEEQRAQKVEPQQIIAMLAWQLHIVALAKAAGSRSPDLVAKEAKLSPYVLKKSSGIARGLGGGELKRLIADLLAIDTRLKRESLDADEAIRNYLLRIAEG